VNQPKKGEFRSTVYTNRPAYADFDSPRKWMAIESIIAKRLAQHPNAVCSYSGGSDSDIMLDLIEHVRGSFGLPQVKFYDNWNRPQSVAAQLQGIEVMK